MSKRVWSGTSGPVPKRPKYDYEVPYGEDTDGYFATEGDENKGESEFEHVKEDDGEVDPLDAFMTELEEQTPISVPSRISKYDVEDEHDDHMESFAKDLAKKNTLTFKKGETLEELEYGSDDEPIVKKRIVESLPPLDHRSISYPPFNKIFYKEPSDTSLMTPDELKAARNALQISVHGHSAPRLISSFQAFHFPEKLLNLIDSQGFQRPTPIQMQAVPIAMIGRDLLGIAATGSGKTLSFLWPMLIHIFEQPPLKSSEPGPIGIIVAPTRELADQIYEEARKFAKCFERRKGEKMERAIRVAPLIGGIGKGDMRLMLRNHSHELVVATPGRLIEMIKLKLISTFRTTMLVLDEADKMFDMGFEPQLKSIVGQIRPDRQTLLFSATFKPTIENLAREILSNPVRVNVGTIGGANKDITQVVEVLPDEPEKRRWLVSHLKEFTLDGSVLIFAGSKAVVDDMTLELKDKFPSIPVASLHGDKTSDERNTIMADFKSGNYTVLVATDLAARGLDVPAIKTVVNFHNARDIDAHTHRIGRTGRAGDKLGIAYTLITPTEKHFAGLLVKNLETAHQEIPYELLAIARQHPNFKEPEDRKKGEHWSRGTASSHHSIQFSGTQSRGGGPQKSSVCKPPLLSTPTFSPSNDQKHSFKSFTPVQFAANAHQAPSEEAQARPVASSTSEAYDPFGDV